MAPRSATRKKSAPARKWAPKSKQSGVESSPFDRNNIKLENQGRDSEATEEVCNQQEGVSAAANDGEACQAAHPVIAVEKIKREVGVSYINFPEKVFVKEEVIEDDSDVEDVVKEEVMEEERDVEGVVKEEVVADERDVEGEMGDHVNVIIEIFCDGGVGEEGGERMEGDRSEGSHGMNENACAAEVTEKCDNAAEGEQSEVRNVDNGGNQLAIVPVAEQNSCKEGSGTAGAQIEALGVGDNDYVLVLNEGGDEEGGYDGGVKDDIGDSGEDNKVNNEDEEHPSVFIDIHLNVRKKEKDLEIFVGRLDKGIVEDDLIQVFGKFGEIRSARLVRNPITNQSRGFAFIRYATVEQAKNALSALRDGIQVGGKHVKIRASQDNDTLYMGNICKLWTKDRVLETLKNYGIENIEEIHLPDDPQKEGKIKGFALLEFCTHADALAAFQRLRKPDAVFGSDRSAKVGFAQTPMHPNEEVLSQVKTVYVEGLTDAWNEEKVNENCKQYGEVVKVKLSRSLGTKRKDYGFVTFTSRESALACVEGINNARIGEGDVKVKASISKPQFKGRLQKQGTRGGFKVTGAILVPSTKEESERENKVVSLKMEGSAKSKRAKKKVKIAAEEKGKALSEPEIGGGGKPNNHQTVTEDQFDRPSATLGRTNRKRKKLHLQTESRGNTVAEYGHNEKRLKKPTGNKWGRQSNNSRKPKRNSHSRKGSNYGADSVKYRNPGAPGYAASAVSYQSHAYATAISRTKRPYADMEPHAGYLEPVSRKQGRSNSGYAEPRAVIPPVRMQYQPHVGYQESAVGTQSRPQTGYREPAVGIYGGPHAGYLEPALGTNGRPHAVYLEPAVRHSQPHAGYLESAVGKYSHEPYNNALSRAARQDLAGSGHSAYGAGSSLPRSYVPNYSNHVRYEGGSSVGGGGHYQSSGAHLPRRAYY